MKNHNPLCTGEEAEYDWPCKRCQQPFRPRRMTRLKGSPFQQCCPDCQCMNLLEMIFATEEALDEEK